MIKRKHVPVQAPCWELINKTNNNIRPLATQNLILSETGNVLTHVLSAWTTSQSSETRPWHTQTHKFHSVAIGNPFNFDGLLLVLKGCERSAEATQSGTNNHFITITPRGATSSQNDEVFTESSRGAEKQAEDCLTRCTCRKNNHQYSWNK